MIGVYILKRADSVVYVGATTQYPLRLKAHKMEFDLVEFIPCVKRNLLWLEKSKIEELRPIENRLHNGPKRKCLTDQWIIDNLVAIKTARRKKYSDDALVEKARNECGYSTRTSSGDIFSTIIRRYDRIKKRLKKAPKPPIPPNEATSTT